MSNIRVLVVDDERGFLNSLCRNLNAHNIDTVYTESASEALIIAKDLKPDIILTDVHLKDMDGFTLCKIIKNNQETNSLPVIIMSGKDIEEDDILKGYEKGADDYIIKPFSVKVLIAKINAVIRRYSRNENKTNIIKKMGIEINPESRVVKKKGKIINLTRKEFDLLILLISKPDKVFTINEILEIVWGYDPALYNDPHTVEVHISSLRKKLGTDFEDRIKNVVGIGYKFEKDLKTY